MCHPCSPALRPQGGGSRRLAIHQPNEFLEIDATIAIAVDGCHQVLEVLGREPHLSHHVPELVLSDQAGTILIKDRKGEFQPFPIGAQAVEHQHSEFIAVDGAGSIHIDLTNHLLQLRNGEPVCPEGGHGLSQFRDGNAVIAIAIHDAKSRPERFDLLVVNTNS